MHATATLEIGPRSLGVRVPGCLEPTGVSPSAVHVSSHHGHKGRANHCNQRGDNRSAVAEAHGTCQTPAYHSATNTHKGWPYTNHSYLPEKFCRLPSQRLRQCLPMQVNAYIPPLIESSDLLHCGWLIRASLRGHFLYPQLVANSLGHEQRSLFRTLALPLVQLTVCC